MRRATTLKPPGVPDGSTSGSNAAASVIGIVTVAGADSTPATLMSTSGPTATNPACSADSERLIVTDTAASPVSAPAGTVTVIPSVERAVPPAGPSVPITEGSATTVSATLSADDDVAGLEVGVVVDVESLLELRTATTATTPTATTARAATATRPLLHHVPPTCGDGSASNEGTVDGGGDVGGGSTLSSPQLMAVERRSVSAPLKPLDGLLGRNISVQATS